jgi:hypothetical protein
MSKRWAVMAAVVAAVVATPAADAAWSGTSTHPTASTSAHQKSAPHQYPGGWVRYHTPSFTAAAGDLCSFRLRSKVLFDREFVRTPQRFRSGDPRVEQYSGPLVVRLTNLHTGRSIIRNLSGYGVINYHRNGSYDFRIHGPAGVGFHPGDSLAPGFYLLRGDHLVRFTAKDKRIVVMDRGSEVNLCEKLS